MMNKSLIEWCDFTWNPVTGCQHGCPYCYATKQANRFSGNVMINKTSEQLRKEEDDRGTRWVLEKPFKNEIGKVTPFPVKFEPMFREYCLPMPAQKKKPAVIFVVSMGDLFGSGYRMNGSGEFSGGASCTMAHVFVSDKEPTEIHTAGRNRKAAAAGKFLVWHDSNKTRPAVCLV